LYAFKLFEGFLIGRGITYIGNAMKRCLNQKKETTMKTKVLLLGAIVTAFTYSTFAGDLFLSPRAKENQIKIASDTTPGQVTTIVYQSPSTPVLLSPRAQGNQIQVVKGTNNDVNPALVCRKMMSGSPKAVAACADNPNMPACNPVTVAPLK
jgi:hypothetical protein